MTGGTPVLVTENGIGTEDDRERIAYVDRALRGVLGCLASGITVQDIYDFLGAMDGRLYFKTTQGAPRGRVIAIDPAKPEKWPIGRTRSS